MCLAVSRYGVEVRTALERIRRISDPVALLDPAAPDTVNTRPGNLFLRSEISRCEKEAAFTARRYQSDTRHNVLNFVGVAALFACS
jgi:hypothetical protein